MRLHFEVQEMRIAVASSDGIQIDQPFGCAGKFYIYEVGEQIALREVREAKQEHDHEARISLIQDCEVLIASKIGCNVVDALFFAGIYSLIISGEVGKTLQKLRPKINVFSLREKNESQPL